MKEKLNYIDLFAGCGGFSEGFEKSDFFEIKAAVEWEKYPVETLRNRLKSKWKIENSEDLVLHFDIQRIQELLEGWANDEVYGSHSGLRKLVNGDEIDLIIGGPPCQAYSVAGRIRDKDGMKNDYRNYLFESYVKVVDEFKPKAFLFENVEGMLSAKPGGIFITKRIRTAFEKIGYEITDHIKRDALINVSEYGVPQSRKRVILLGLRKEVWGNEIQNMLTDFYQFILPKRKEDKVTIKDALKKLRKFIPTDRPFKYRGRKLSHGPKKIDCLNSVKFNDENHIPRYHNERDIRIFKDLAEDATRKKPFYDSAEKLKELYTLRTGKNSKVHKYNVLNWNETSNTIPAHLHKDGLRHIHPDPEQARTITPREAARIQTFDDDFSFIGGQSAAYKMIGNAVPVLFAKKLSMSVKELFNTYTEKSIK